MKVGEWQALFAFGIGHGVVWNSVSLRERARVRESNKEYLSSTQSARVYNDESSLGLVPS
jgi:hypothetical protein